MPDDASVYWGFIFWDWVAGGSGGSAYYDVHSPEHTVNRMRIVFPAQFPLKDVIEAYGEPSHIVARRRDNVETRETGRVIYDLHFVYWSHGFILSEDRFTSKPIFTDKDNFRILTLFAPNAQGLSDATGISPEFLVSWQGFQSYNFYCKDERTFQSCD